MRLLDTLKKEEPKKSQVSLLAFVRKNFKEIEEAKRMGYSWEQIFNTIKLMHPEISATRIRNLHEYMRKIRKGKKF